MKKSELKNAAVEMNALLGCSPAIPTEGDKVKAKLIEASKLLEPADILTDGTKAVLVELGVALPSAPVTEKPAKPAKATKKVAKPEEEEDEDDDVPEPDDEEEDDAEEDIPVGDDDDDDEPAPPIKHPTKKGKPAKAVKAPKVEKPSKPAKVAKEPKPRFTRAAAVTRAIGNHKGETVTVEDILTEAEEIYGQTPNTKETMLYIRIVLSVMTEMTAVTVSGDNIKVSN